MSTIAILTDVEISVAEFDAFILSIGGVKVNDTYQFEWRVSDGWKHLWIFLATDELHTYEALELVTIAAKLNAQPQCQFVIEMSSAENVEDFAIDFIRKFSATWRCIIYNCIDAFVTVDELLAMEGESKDEFWNGKDIRRPYVETTDDISTLISNSQYALALRQLRRERHPVIKALLPRLKYTPAEDTEMITSLTNQQVTILRDYLNGLRTRMLMASVGLVIIGCIVVAAGIVGIVLLPRSRAFATSIGPIMCIGLPLGLPIIVMGLSGLWSLRDPAYGMWS